jgi:hypothetical protein
MTRFTWFAIAVITGYVAISWRGVDLLPTSEQSHIPASVRTSPGGYRSYHVYHGFHGGK